MRNRRRDSIKKERITMLICSALVLGALTMTGLYMKGKEIKEQNDGYSLDMAALEKQSQRLDQIGRQGADPDPIIGGKPSLDKNIGNSMKESPNEVSDGLNKAIDGELDYMPLEKELVTEAGTSLIQIPGLTDEAPEVKNDLVSGQPDADKGKAVRTKEDIPSLCFEEGDPLSRPVSGEILLPYSMDGSIYIATLDQYKYNPATIFAAEVGENVIACADGRVASVANTPTLGESLVLELGGGFSVTYGQLENIAVQEGSYVKAGTVLGTIANPTKYYSLEGPNLYFEMKKDGTPVNTEHLYE